MAKVKNKEKTTKLSNAVKAAVETHGYLKTPLGLGLINYSALARKLKPQLDKQLQQNLTVEAIAMALHRQVEPEVKKHSDNTPKIMAVIAGSKIQLMPNMTAIHYTYERKLQESIDEAKKTIENQGGNLYSVERTNEISLITQDRFRNFILKLASPSSFLSEFQNSALLTLQYPPIGMNQPGVFNYLTQRLTQADINLLGIFTSYSKISFLLHEKDAPRAYELFNRSILAAKNAV